MKRPSDHASPDERGSGVPSLDAPSVGALRRLPSVDELVRQDGLGEQRQSISHASLVRAAREVLAQARDAVRAGQQPPKLAELTRRVALAAAAARVTPLRAVINATGVLVNTNLGRSPLSVAAIEAMRHIAAGYSNLEYELDSGERGSRQSHVRDLLCELTGAEAALVVNNNAAAILVALSGLAAGREVIVSRGELVEIGGGFRVPEVMRQGGARLVEVGTTNRTRAEDFAAAIGPETGALLVVHPSNFRIVGFTTAPTRAALAALAHAHHLPLVEDLGSGCLLPTERWGLAHEPTPMESLAAGVDVLCFSGDKLLGGPQAGVLLGRADRLAQLERHPLMRAVRIDKLTLVALIATLESYRNGSAVQDIPIWRMIAMPLPVLHDRAAAWVARLNAQGMRAAVVAGESAVGGGSLPGETLPTALCAIDPRAERGDAERGDAAQLASELRQGTPSVVARVSRGHVLLDPRTVDPAADDELLAAVATAWKSLDACAPSLGHEDGAAPGTSLL